MNSQKHGRLVSIGIPTYNRVANLKRTVATVLAQDYADLEIVISDNASTDETSDFCQKICEQDKRIKYIRQPTNQGATFNFKEVFNRCHGDFFMWIGDDDWIEASYISECMKVLQEHDDYSLVCGKSKYFFKDGSFLCEGNKVNLLQDSRRERVLAYYRQVTDNGTFYGIMRRSQLAKIIWQNTMGGDWLIISSIAFMGKIKTLEHIAINRLHRDQSEWKDGYKTMSLSAGLPRFQGEHPHLSIAISSFNEIAWVSPVYDLLTTSERILLAHNVQRLICERYKVQISNRLFVFFTCLDRYEKDRLNQDALADLDKSKKQITNYPLNSAEKQLLALYQSDADLSKIVVDGVIFQLQQGREGGVSRVWKALLVQLSKSLLAERIVLLDRGGTAPDIEGIARVKVSKYDFKNRAEDSKILDSICVELGAGLFISTYYSWTNLFPAIIMLYDMVPERLKWDLSNPEWQSKQNAISKALFYLAISNATLKDFRIIYPKESIKQIFVIPLAASNAFCMHDVATVESFKDRFSITKPYFLIVGQPWPHKNLFLFFKAFSRLPKNDHYQIVVSGGSGRFKQEFSQYLDSTVCSEYFFTDSDLSIAYSGAIALVYPSLYEGFGLPPLEAMQSGCPVITCRNSSIPEVVGDAALFVGESDVDGMIEALIEVQKKEVRRKLIKLGQERAKLFSWEESGALLVKEIEKIQQCIDSAPEKYIELQAGLTNSNALEMIDAYKEFLTKYPSFSLAHNDLAVLYAQSGDTEKALWHYEAAVNINPENIIFVKNLADFYYAVKNDVPKALSLYVKGLSLNPEDIEILTMLGNIAIENGLFSDAYEFFSKIKKIDPQKNEVDEILSRLAAMMQSETTQSETAPKAETNASLSSSPSAVQTEYLVSAIVSAYNSERFMRGCLEDLERQTIADRLEIIVVDSGSQQNEEKIVREFQDKYNNIRYIRTEKRETVYASWNRGIKVARGKYISNANSDDRHKANAFERMAGYLGEHPKIALVYADVFITEKENEVFDKFTLAGKYTWHDWDRKVLLEKGCFMGPQPMWRRSVHDLYGYFDPAMVSSGDYEFWLRISQTETFHHIREFLGLYLKSPGSIEHRSRREQQIENEKILKDYRNAAEQGVLLRFALIDELRGFYGKNISGPEKDILLYVERLDAVAGTKLRAAESVSWYSTDKSELQHSIKTGDFHKSYELIRKALLAGAADETVLNHLNTAISGIVLSKTEPSAGEPHPAGRAKQGLASIIITGDTKAHFVECVKAIKDNTNVPCEIAIVAQDSEREKRSLIKKLSSIAQVAWFDYVDADQCASAINRAVGAGNGEFIVLLKSDVIVSKGWLSGMLDCLSAVPDAGIVEPMANNADGTRQAYPADCKSSREVDAFAARYRETYRHRRFFSENVGCFCTLFRKELYEKIGSFDEKLGCGKSAIADYGLRARLLGYRNVVAGDVFVYRLEKDDPSAPTQNMSQFNRKWSGIQADTPLGRRLIVLKAMEKSNEFHQKGEDDEAVKTLLAGMSQAPEEDDVRYALVDLLIEKRQFQDALDTLAPLSKDDAKKIVREGYCREGLKMLDEAEECARRAIALHPSFPMALNLQGVLAYDHGDATAAERSFQDAIASDPSYAEPCANLGAVQWSAGEREKGLSFLKRGFILSPSTSDIVNLYFTAAVERGTLEEAEVLFRSAKAIYPRNRMLTFLLIDLLLREEKHAEAMKEIEDAVMVFGADDGMLQAALAVREKVGPMEIDKKKSGSISLCMIVKDEEKYLAGCLMSVKPVVDEIIVVDTGSTDRTREIARALGAKVYDFPWTEDFSAARNVSLSHARGNWIFVLDADEVISSKDYNPIRKLTSRKGKPVAYTIVTRNYINTINKTKWTANDGEYPAEERGLGWMASDKVRLFPNDRGIVFINPVHEIVEPSLQKAGIEFRACPIVVHHYGKLDTEKALSKGENYYLLGLKKLEENGDEVKALKELAVQAGELKHFTEAIDLWRRALRLYPNMAEAYVNMTSIYSQMGFYRESLDAGKKAVEIDPESKDAVCNYALSEIYGGNAERAVDVLEELLKKENNFPQANIILGVAYLCLRKNEKGIAIFSDIHITGEQIARTIKPFADALIGAGRQDYATALLIFIGE